ncbi:hypothetical protein QQF64_021270 [Cirrhinus molitorella]|uniref:ALK and LTK ligand 2 n=1 Tax=Cirrhinus molitorella TaxID=172907 RepID=A0ABR3LBH7_9TELE
MGARLLHVLFCFEGVAPDAQSPQAVSIDGQKRSDTSVLRSSAGLARTLVAGAMRALRAPVLVMGLVMLICTTALSDASVNKVEKTFRRIKDIMTLAENSVDDGSAQKKESVPRDIHRLKTETGETILKIFPRDLRKKEKVIRILTGPLYFSPKCRKHVYRLYHNTRDCTIPAYYKRCARLLTRLAGSPRCQEG